MTESEHILNSDEAKNIDGGGEPLRQLANLRFLFNLFLEYG